MTVQLSGNKEKIEMLCDLCTMDIVRGTMYSARRPKGGSPYRVCDSCRSLIINGTQEYVDDPLCVGKLPEWTCKAMITGPCKPAA